MATIETPAFVSVLFVGDGYIAAIIDMKGGLVRTEGPCGEADADSVARMWAREFNIDLVDDEGKTVSP